MKEIRVAIESHVLHLPKSALARLNSNEEVSREELIELAKDKNWYIRASVAKNPKTPKEILEILAKDEDWIVREAIAKNLNTPKEILEILARDKDENVRETAMNMQYFLISKKIH